MNPNVLGIDVGGLDVEAFLRGCRVAFSLAALCWLALLLRIRRAGFLLAGVVAANAFVWFTTNYPLARPYALGASADRLNNLAMCQVVAAGHTPLETWLVGQSQFGPYLRPYVMLWTVLVSALSGFEPARLLRVYAFLPLVVSCGFALTLYLGLGSGRDALWSRWQRAVIAGFATLMASAATDFQGPFEVPWALMFLLKPNHALGLVLLPLVLRAFAVSEGWGGRLRAALLLHLLAWVFVLHMAYFAAGLVALVVLSALFQRQALRRDLADALAAIGLNLAVLTPYAVWLLLQPRPAQATTGGAEIVAAAASTSMLLEATLRNGLVFPAGLWGAWLAWSRGGRLGRLLAGQLLAALLIWLGYAVVVAAGIAPQGMLGELLGQPDEIFFWLRFLVAACAGIGAWDVARRASGTLLPALGPAARAALLGLVCLPSSLPYWWHPPDTDRYFERSRAPLPDELRRFGEFLLQETDQDAVLSGDPWLLRWAAALAGRRSLLSMGPPPPPDLERRQEATRAILEGADPENVRAAAAPYGVEYLVVTPKLLAGARLPDARPERLDSRPELVRVFAVEGTEHGFIRVYQIVPTSGR